MWPALLAGQLGLNFLSGRKERRAQDRADEATNNRTMRNFNAMLAQRTAEQQAEREYGANMTHASGLGHKGRSAAFDMLQDAGDEDKEARKKLAAALEGFGAETKKARLKQARQKRKAGVKKAVKGGKMKGTTGGAGRGGIRGLASAARSQGLSRAADTSAMAAGLSAYGDAAMDEMQKLSVLGGDIAAQNKFSEWTRRTAKEQEQAANRNQGIFERAASRRMTGANRNASLLGPSYLDPDLINRINPNNELEKAGSAALGTALALGY